MMTLPLLLVFLGQVGPNVSKLKEGEVLRTSTLCQIVDPAGGSRVEIRHQTELTAGRTYETTTVYTMPSGEEYILRQNLTFNPLTTEDSLQFPDRQKLVLIGRPSTKAPDATSTSTARPGLPTAGTLSFGKRHFDVDLSQDSGGEFTSKEGREFRETLPPLPDDLIESLSSLKRDDLCQTLSLCGTASVFFEAYKDRWLKEKDNAWELKTVGNARAQETPVPGRQKSSEARVPYKSDR